MESTFWERLVAEGHPVPRDRPLADLTSELTTMLGDPDPRRRDTIAYDVLATWIDQGVYDELLEGLGDGMTAGLRVGLGERDTDTVFRRSFSALVLAECVARDNEAHLLPPDVLLRWGDHAMTWLVRERDLRGFVPGRGWAHAVAHGADALRALAGAESFGRLELTVLLDVVADRLLGTPAVHLVHGEPDRLAAAVMAVLRRDIVVFDVVEPWLARLGAAAAPSADGPDSPDEDPYLRFGNVQAFLRALHLQVALATDPPACRADLLLVLIDWLKATNATYLA
ncbi:MAG: DUF2785 domain-containing protein [Nocardioidaceae bacterium]